MSNNLSDNYQQEQAKEGTKLTLQRLVELYEKERFVLSGIDSEAQENNRLVIEAIKNTGERLNKSSNDIFAIQMGGSRIKGYNTKDSDIDLVLVTPDTTRDSNFVFEILKEELEKEGLTNHLDLAMSMWAQYEVKTDPNEFIYTVDHYRNELITLFGYAPYQNPNLLLARLAALEVVMRYSKVGYDWDSPSLNFAETYLGDRSHLIPKLAERMGVEIRQVAGVLSKELFTKRHAQFGIDHPDDMYQELTSWYKQNKKHLKPFVMKDVYEQVKEMLDNGF